MEGDGIDLRDLDERFKGVAAADKNAPAPDGTYQAALEIFRVERSKDEEGNRTGAPVLLWGFRIVGPKCAGRFAWHRNQMATDVNISWLKADLETAGLKLERLSELQDHLEELIGAVFEITVRTKAQYTNVYINSRVDPGSVLVAEDGEVPF